MVVSDSSGLVPIAAATAILDIDPVTLRRWLSAAGLQVVVDPVDRRRRYLSTTDLVSLARLHRRYLSSLSVDAQPGQCCPHMATARDCPYHTEIAQLQNNLAELRRLVNTLLDKHNN